MQEISVDTDEDVIIKLEHVFINFFLLKDEVNIYQSLSDGVSIS